MYVDNYRGSQKALFARYIPKASDRKFFADAAFGLMPGSFSSSKPMHHR